MATIKAGFYRLNNALTNTVSASADINFTCSVYDAENGVTIVANFDRLKFDYLDDTYREVAYRLVDTVPNVEVGAGYHVVYTDQHLWEHFHPDLQSIRVTEDTEVSDEFYALFEANAKGKRFVSFKFGFAKLNIGEAVYSSGGKCFKRLTTKIV